jgi:suppressor of fused-like protein
MLNKWNFLYETAESPIQRPRTRSEKRTAAASHTLTDPITSLCLKVYPEQPDFVQASSKLPYWLNGSDPLDHVNMFINSPHESLVSSSPAPSEASGSRSGDSTSGGFFHLVSLGLSDLHGDGRVHKYMQNEALIIKFKNLL